MWMFHGPRLLNQQCSPLKLTALCHPERKLFFLDIGHNSDSTSTIRASSKRPSSPDSATENVAKKGKKNDGEDIAKGMST